MNWMQSRTPEERKAIAAKSVVTRQKNIQERKARVLADMDKRDSLRQEIKELEDRVSKLRRLEIVNKTAMTLTSQALWSEVDIVKTANTWALATGIYFLIDGGKIVYVGQSVNVYSRISYHHDKVFESFAFIPCEKEMLDKLESLYIHVLRPPLNGDHVGGAKHAPIAFDKLLRASA